MLAHAAAFCVDATVIHADRPLADKIQRLYEGTSLEDLDAGVGVQCCINYSDMLGQRLQHSSLEAAAVVHNVHILQRDAILTYSLQRAASRQSSMVVGVVGADHLEGIAKYWDMPARQYLQEAERHSMTTLASSEPDTPDYQGVKRALFERFFDLSASPATCAAMQQYLAPLTDEALEAYELTWEIYGNSRMMLACLNQADLKKVCSGQACDMWETLSSVRALRPVNGGKAYSEEVAFELRQLMLELS